MSYVWRTTDEVLLPIPDRAVPVHIRAYRRGPEERAVVIGEFSDQDANMLEILPWAWRRIAADIDIDAVQVVSFVPTAADAFRRHVSGNDIGGGPVTVHEVQLAPTTHSRRARRCLLADGPIVGVWTATEYRHSRWRRLVPKSQSIRWEVPADESISR